MSRSEQNARYHNIPELTLSDLPDEITHVWYRLGSGPTNSAHLDRWCSRLDYSEGATEKNRSVLWDDTPVCKDCIREHLNANGKTIVGP